MTKFKGSLTGILGTVIVHLIAGIIFMSLQLKSLQKEKSDEYVLELTTPEEPPVIKKTEFMPKTTMERILQDDQEMLNIARNLSDKSEQKIDPSEYINKVKEELIQSGKLGEDNYIDAQKKLNEEQTGDAALTLDDKSNLTKKEESQESRKMASAYKGATRIYYDLPGRNHLYLPIPIYLCQGSGKIALSIEVDQKGDVLKTQVISGESTTTDPCLIETAEKAAQSSRFNPDAGSKKLQTGTITYIFVAQ